MRHSKHYFRAGFLILGGFLAFLIVRSLLIPPSFGQFGHYRGEALGDEKGRSPFFGSRESCDDCHAEISSIHGRGGHQGVPCQDCHAPLSVHIDSEGVFLEPMPIDRSPRLCLRCHGRLPSRPEKFPQIDVEDHVESKGMPLAEGVCLNCHQVHNPGLGGR